MRRAPTVTQVLQLVLDNSLLLIAGAAAALVWANLDAVQYTRVTRALHVPVNDIGMVFFFALAAKEVYEAMLPGGPLASPRRAVVPILAALGGMAVPASIYVAAAMALDRPDLVRGWAIPCATDIAFSYLVARIVFPPNHAAIPFLLLLAIADDALGLIVLAVFYPTGTVAPAALVMWLAPALLVAWVFRKLGIVSFWAYTLVPGVMSWLGLHYGGLHPALALVPILPFMPHEKSDLSLFGNRAAVALTTMREFEEWWRIPVQIILLLFGFANAGVPLTSAGVATWIVAASLIAGKPVGIIGMTALAGWLGFRRAPELNYRALVVVGMAAGIGFTVALFFATAAFLPGDVLNEAKMGALVSFVAAPLAILAARVLRLKTSA